MTAELGFDGKVALITGAGGGLGRQHALLLASRGALVVVNDLGGAVDGSGSDVGAAQKVANEIKTLGGEAVADTNSVATAEGGAAMVKSAIDNFGRIDIVVNNAGFCATSFHNMDPSLMNPVFDVHLKGAFHVTQPAFVHMREQGSVVSCPHRQQPDYSETSGRQTMAQQKWDSLDSLACWPSKVPNSTSKPMPLLHSPTPA